MLWVAKMLGSVEFFLFSKIKGYLWKDQRGISFGYRRWRKEEAEEEVDTAWLVFRKLYFCIFFKCLWLFKMSGDKISSPMWAGCSPHLKIDGSFLLEWIKGLLPRLLHHAHLDTKSWEHLQTQLECVLSFTLGFFYLTIFFLCAKVSPPSLSIFFGKRKEERRATKIKSGAAWWIHN